MQPQRIYVLAVAAPNYFNSARTHNDPQPVLEWGYFTNSSDARIVASEKQAIVYQGALVSVVEVKPHSQTV
jgi:hypothetical protein